jgi:hypothetical protein
MKSIMKFFNIFERFKCKSLDDEFERQHCKPANKVRIAKLFF